VGFAGCSLKYAANGTGIDKGTDSRLPTPVESVPCAYTHSACGRDKEGLDPGGEPFRPGQGASEGASEGTEPGQSVAMFIRRVRIR
jgi:hypothetical protein